MPVLVKEIISFLPPVEFLGDEYAKVNCVIQLDTENLDAEILSWCNVKNMHRLVDIKKGTIIIPVKARGEAKMPECNYIIVDNPRGYFNEILRHFFWVESNESSVSESAKIATTAKVGTNPFIGDHVVIKENCIIGDNVKILSNTIIHANTVLGNAVVIGSNNIIGNYGFGYEKNSVGNYTLMPHIGNVIIESDVEIGNNNCIDRAVLGSTIIGSNTKIHNFVQVAHGVHIGKNCLVTANVTISGSTMVGDNVWLGPGVTIANKLKIGKGAYLALGTVVLSDVQEGATIIGNPGRIVKIDRQ